MIFAGLRNASMPNGAKGQDDRARKTGFFSKTHWRGSGIYDINTLPSLLLLRPVLLYRRVLCCYRGRA